MKKYIITGLITIAILAFMQIIVLFFATPALKGVTPAMSRLGAVASSSVMVVAGDIRILATSTRSLAIVCNDGANKVYLGIDSDKKITYNGTLTFNAGIALAANTCYTFNNDNLWAGSIRASSTISSNLLITEF